MDLTSPYLCDSNRWTECRDMKTVKSRYTDLKQTSWSTYHGECIVIHTERAGDSGAQRTTDTRISTDRQEDESLVPLPVLVTYTGTGGVTACAECDTFFHALTLFVGLWECV